MAAELAVDVNKTCFKVCDIFVKLIVIGDCLYFLAAGVGIGKCASLEIIKSKPFEVVPHGIP